MVLIGDAKSTLMMVLVTHLKLIIELYLAL